MVKLLRLIFSFNSLFENWKWVILYDLISTRSNIGGSRLQFHKREKFAAVRKAKLRLSNIKLEELAQILRGQSKQIKH